jgi:TonB family protein
VIWISGSCVALFRLGLEVVKLWRLISRARIVADPHVRQVSIRVGRALGLPRVPSLLRSPDAVIPITWGFHRCRVLLPDCSCNWPDERLHAVLAHEFGHIRRGDWLVHVATQIVCAVYWFHPLFWTAERALHRESEHAADDHVLRAGMEGSAYASHLVEIVRASRVSLSPRRTVVAMARTSHLERRVVALLGAGANRSSVSRRDMAIVGVIAISASLPIAAMTIEQPARLYTDVVVQILNLPPATPTGEVQGPAPEAPAVRYVGTADGAPAGEPRVAPAIAEYTTPALYSDQARQRRIEGIVTIAVRVDERGNLTSARVVKGLGFGLDQNALVAVRQWRFLPGTSQGKARAMDADIDVEFNLKTEALNELIANDMVTLVGPGVAPPRVARTTDIASPVIGVRGSVILDVVLLEDGSPKIVRILQSLSTEADESAVRHFEQWRFSPAMRNGVPVKVRMNAEVRFHG